MKIRYIDERINTNILEKDVYYESVNDNMFNGYISAVDIYKVDHIVKVPRDNRPDECILADGYKRFRILPIDKHYAINAMYDENFNFVEFYIDLIRCVKVEEKTNVPYMEDLYLDIVYTHKDEIIILDEDELETALKEKEISQEDYDNVINAKNEIITLLSDTKKAHNLISYCTDNLYRLFDKMDRKEK